MDIPEFKKRVIKANGFDIYWYRIIYFLAVCVGLYVLYDTVMNYSGLISSTILYLKFLLTLALIGFGISGILLIPKRYKVLTINSGLSAEQKSAIIVKLITQLGDPFYNEENSFYSFTYKQGWFNYDYLISLSFSDTNFLLSVQGHTGGFKGSGFIDFGGAEKQRKSLVSILSKLLYT